MKWLLVLLFVAACGDDSSATPVFPLVNLQGPPPDLYGAAEDPNQ